MCFFSCCWCWPTFFKSHTSLPLPDPLTPQSPFAGSFTLGLYLLSLAVHFACACVYSRQLEAPAHQPNSWPSGLFWEPLNQVGCSICTRWWLSKKYEDLLGTRVHSDWPIGNKQTNNRKNILSMSHFCFVQSQMYIMDNIYPVLNVCDLIKNRFYPNCYC